jgi:cystathionine beta-lyase
MMDNTWGIHHFMPFQHGVDVSIQALTKYVGGHSDVLLGSITVNSEKDYEIVRGAASQMGHFAAPDDCWLALRGARTMPIRLQHQEKSGLEVARWFENRPEVLSVLHPALPSHPQHALWKRDFTGACSLFGVVFKPRYTEADIFSFIDNLKLFGIGASWGGFESLALPTTGFITRSATSPDLGGFTVRIHIGLEDVGDLVADLTQGLAALPK